MTSREKILSAARQLFVQRGFHQAGMAELAKAATLSVGQIYRIFPSKSDIILTIVEEEMIKRQMSVERAILRISKGSPTLVDKVEVFILEWLESQGVDLSFDILAEAVRNPDIMRCIADRGPIFRESVRLFTLAIEPRLDVRQQAIAEEFLFDLLFGMGHRRLSLPSLSVPATANATAKLIVASIQSLRAASA